MVIELNFSYHEKMTKFVIFLNFIIQLENVVIMFVNILFY